MPPPGSQARSDTPAQEDRASLPNDDARMAQALGLLKGRLGIDLKAYRAATIRRRLDARMRLAGFQDLGAYIEKLRSDETELNRLLSHLTIKVTRFYRNHRSFSRLQQTALSDLVENGRCRAPRIWSAGCSTGEEAWTLAMLLEEAGAELETERPQIQATDVDESALAHGRGRWYPARSMVELPFELRRRWIREGDIQGANVQVDEALARRVDFRLHDLVSATQPPLGWQFDLVCCRNVLIYLNESRRKGVLDRLLHGLRPGGYLFLGEAEWPEPLAAGSRLEVVDRSARIFQLP